MQHDPLAPPLPHDIDGALGKLDVAGEDHIPDLAWIERSWAEPDPFAAALCAYLARITGPHPPRSRLGAHYDLYHDFIGRHAATDRVAWRALNERGGEEILGYAALHAAAGAWASAWVERGASPGDVVVLLLPLGSLFLIALGAALRLGLCIAVLPPESRGYAERRLAAIAPRFVVVDPRLAPPKLPGGTMILPHGDRERPPAAPPFTYRPGAACAHIFSPLQNPTDRASALSAADAYLGALGDGVFAYRLSPADPLATREERPSQPVLAAPAMHREQHLPCLLFATLLLGATFFHMTYDALEKQIDRIAGRRLRALLLTRRAHDVLALAGKRIAVTLWLRDVGEPFDWLTWRAFSVAQRQQTGSEPLLANVLVDAAAGGALLFSPSRPGISSARVLPIPGRPFSLLDVASGEPSPSGHGIFVRRPDRRGFFVLASQGAEYLYGGTLVPRRAARVYPRAEVARAVPAIESVVGAAIVAVPSLRAPGDSLFILLLFVGGATLEDEAEKKVREDCRAAVVAAVGEPLAPDRVEIVPLYPRRSPDTGAVDLNWCQQQYATGALARKARHPVFQALTALRDQVPGAGRGAAEAVNGAR